MSPRRPGVRPRPSPSASSRATEPDVIPALAQRGRPPPAARIRTVATVRRVAAEPPLVELEIEVEGLDEEDLVAALAAVPDDPGAPPDPRPGPGVRQAGHRRRWRGTGRPGGPGRRQRGRPPQPARRADQRGHDPARRRGEHRGRRARRRGPAAGPSARSRGFDHGRRHHDGGAGAAGERHPGHRAEHGRLDHRARRTSSSPTRSRPARWP